MISGAKKDFYATLIGNSLISVTKFFAAAYTDSSAILIEGIHSLVETGNQGLLLRTGSNKEPADKKHPFRFSAALYFWTFIVAILKFAVGYGISIYEGIYKLNHLEPITSLKVNYIVIILSMIFNAYVFDLALKEFNSVKGDLTYLAANQKSKNPALFTVFLDDAAAMAGLVVAFVGLLIAKKFMRTVAFWSKSSASKLCNSNGRLPCRNAICDQQLGLQGQCSRNPNEYIL